MGIGVAECPGCGCVFGGVEVAARGEVLEDARVADVACRDQGLPDVWPQPVLVGLLQVWGEVDAP